MLKRGQRPGEIHRPMRGVALEEDVVLKAGRFVRSAVIGLSISATPCIAAGDSMGGSHLQRRSGAFAGASFRIPLSGAPAERPMAQVQLATFHRFEDPGSRSVVGMTGSSLELGLGPGKQPKLYLNGRPLGEAERRLGVRGAAAWVLGGIAVAAGGLLILGTLLDNKADAEPQPAPPLG